MRGAASTSTEVSLKQQTHEHTIKLTNFKRFVNTQREFRSNLTEIFPGKKIAFLIKIAYIGNGRYLTGPDGNLINTTENDKFFSLELEAAEGVDPPRLAGWRY